MRPARRLTMSPEMLREFYLDLEYGRRQLAASARLHGRHNEAADFDREADEFKQAANDQESAR